MTTKKLSEDEAISLMTIAVEFGVTQVVDGKLGRARGDPQRSLFGRRGVGPPGIGRIGGHAQAAPRSHG
jgi:hypothetical protein